MRYLSRNKVYQKVQPTKDAKKVYIFCEGEETEIRYFKYFQGLSSNIDIIALPSVNGKTDPIKLKENAELLFWGNMNTPPHFEISNEYKDEIWFVIDTDEWNEGDKISELRDFCSQKNISVKQWNVAQSNPSFEIWLYYHFHGYKPDTAEVGQYSTFKQFVNSKIDGGFDSRKMPILIENATLNSKTNFEISGGQPVLFSTEVFYLGEVILPFVKSQLEKAKEIMNSAEINKF